MWMDDCRVEAARGADAPAPPRRAASSPSSATSGPRRASSAATTTCSSARPTARACRSRRRRASTLLYAGLNAAERAERRAGHPARAHRRRLDARTTPASSGWSRSTPSTAPSSGSATCTSQNGFEVGFVGGSDDHRSRPGPHRQPSRHAVRPAAWPRCSRPTKTADAIFDALRARSAYATSGERILLDADLNGTADGHATADAGERRSDRVQGLGHRADRSHRRGARTARWRARARYLDRAARTRTRGCRSASSRRPRCYGEALDNPRAYRPWKGTLARRGRARRSRCAGLRQRLRSSGARSTPTNPALIASTSRRAAGATRCCSSSTAPPRSHALRVRARGRQGAARGAGAGAAARRFPRSTATLSFVGLADGRLEHELPVDVHTDRIELQIVDPDGAARSRVRVHRPRQGVAPGDYYYVRVTQLDGGRAWSSPFFFGAPQSR